MSYRFDGEKVEKYIEANGLKKGFIAKKIDSNATTFGRWIKGETPIPFVKAAELADILDCN
ncbi:helix-turn-helix domain-containing protein, partial [Halobacillus trueperi]|uniref:helix-turn-helix domain-containing protein n=1 Tax=Halobacillus trueperi TaxID=156205 RepID=UPI0015F298D5